METESRILSRIFYLIQIPKHLASIKSKKPQKDRMKNHIKQFFLKWRKLKIIYGFEADKSFLKSF